MSRIEQVLRKAEEEGTVHRTRGIGEAAAPVARRTPVLVPEPELPHQVDVVDSPVAPNERPAPARVETSVRLHPLLVAATASHSPAAERYRSLRTRIAQTENGAACRVLMMTSPGRSEGKSITSLNLGLTMAQEFHRRVLVMDADLRQPSVHALLGLPVSPGLSDVLLGGASLDDVMISIPDFRLTVIPAGLPPERPTELLGSTAMRRLLEELRRHFDRVLLDTPPTSAVADATVVSRMVDGVIVVVRAGKTLKPAIERTLSEVDSARVLGLVLNDIGASPEMDYRYDAYGTPRPGSAQAAGGRTRGQRRG